MNTTTESHMKKAVGMMMVAEAHHAIKIVLGTKTGCSVEFRVHPESKSRVVVTGMGTIVAVEELWEGDMKPYSTRRYRVRMDEPNECDIFEDEEDNNPAIAAAEQDKLGEALELLREAHSDLKPITSYSLRKKIDALISTTTNEKPARPQ